MHELGLCEDIVHAIERRAGDRPVPRVKIRVGCLHHVHPDAFEQSFAMASMGTVVEGASAELVVEPLSVTCSACGRSSESAEPLPACPGCGSFDIEQNGGDQLVLESLAYKS
jgi:hydrogenase nickel incorporation protein HypA/HybF